MKPPKIFTLGWRVVGIKHNGRPLKSRAFTVLDAAREYEQMMIASGQCKPGSVFTETLSGVEKQKGAPTVDIEGAAP